MAGFGWIMTIIIGALAGWIAERIMKSSMGLLANILLGIAGAIFGNWLFRILFSANPNNVVGQLIVAIIGACLLIWIARAITGRSKRL